MIKPRGGMLYLVITRLAIAKAVAMTTGVDVEVNILTLAKDCSEVNVS